MKRVSRAERYMDHNMKVHDAGTSSYERKHTEIYNPTEQARISDMLKRSISEIQSRDEGPMVLDFGAGTGNLSKHLLDLGTQVLAADVSPKSLALLEEIYGATGRIETLLLNSTDLSNIENSSVDMIATYSVLHHVPDYLGIVEEFVRILKPGGVIYIDHECASSIWLDDPGPYVDYKIELQRAYGKSSMEKLARKFQLLFSPVAWRRLLDRKFYGLNAEGDIHVFKDDHIEWDKVEKILLKNCQKVEGLDYLVCRELDPAPPLHRKYSGQCVDMRVVIYRKN